MIGALSITYIALIKFSIVPEFNGSSDPMGCTLLTARSHPCRWILGGSLRPSSLAERDLVCSLRRPRWPPAFGARHGDLRPIRWREAVLQPVAVPDNVSIHTT